MSTQPLAELTLPEGIRSRRVNSVNGLDVHVLEAGYDSPSRPCILLLHGFPELAYSFRNIMLPLAAKGYYVVAPDQRGFGRTAGWSNSYDGDISQFGMINLVRDVVTLLGRLGRPRVDLVVGHDFGSMVAACCALFRPDIFQSLTMMSAPFPGVAKIAPAESISSAIESKIARSESADIHDELATLDPPRKHYQWYYSSRQANEDMWHCAQGMSDFLRAYFHFKSADWIQNRPEPLTGWTASELARMPRYYIMDLGQTMAETVAPEMPEQSAVNQCEWLTESELDYYSESNNPTRMNSQLWRAGRLKYRPVLLLERRTGEFINDPVISIPWQTNFAQTGAAPTWSMAPVTGSSRSRHRQSALCCSSFSQQLDQPNLFEPEPKVSA